MEPDAGRTARTRTKDRLFPKFASDYFAQLRQQYTLVLDQSNAAPPTTIVRLFEAADAAPADVSWADIFALETAYLYAIPDQRVAAELAYARERYQQVVGEGPYAHYSTTMTADIAKMTPAECRAELLTLAERIRYLYTFVPPKESIRNQLSIKAAISTLIVALIGIAGYAVVEYHRGNIWTILVVLFVGQMGGFLSVQQRLQMSTEGSDPLFKELQLNAGQFSVSVIAPMSGAVFAVVLYFLFVAGLLSGGLFPQFGPQGASTVLVPPPHYHDVTEFLDKASPTTLVDWGKLVVWAFIAGFAERFVPDVLNRLTVGQFTPAERTPVPAPAAPSSRQPEDAASARSAEQAAVKPGSADQAQDEPQP